MKKIIKVSLTIGIIMSVLGLTFSIIGGICGGFKTSSDKVNHSVSKFMEKNPRIIGFIKGNHSGMTQVSGESEQISVEEIQNIEIELKAGDYKVCPWEKDYVGFSDFNGMNVYYQKSGDTLKILAENKHLFGTFSASEVGIYLPQNKNYQTFFVDLSAGEIDIENIVSTNAVLDTDAGECIVQNLTADNAKFSIGAGDIEANHINVRTGSVDVSMGSVSLEGMIQESFDISCSMGDVEFKPSDGINSYNYDYKVNMGDIQIGDREHSGMSVNSDVNNNAPKTIYIDCNMGSVEVN